MEIGFLYLGFDPLSHREDVPWMPKERYALMRTYMPTRGHLGLDMMTRTATVQVNLDYISEKDMIQKMRVGMALQPIVTALFSNSSLKERIDTGYQSYRAHVWEHTDPDRTGFLDFVFDDHMGFERYVDYLLDMPMYFVYRNATYINALGQSFRSFLNGQLPALPGQYPTLQDWENHISTAFPQVRLKKYIEMRGADVGPPDLILALPAFWTGLLYDKDTLSDLHDLVVKWDPLERKNLSKNVAKEGLRTLYQGRPLIELAKECLKRAEKGLEKRQKKDTKNRDERQYLAPLWEIVERKKTLSDQVRESWKNTKEEQNKIIQDLFIPSHFSENLTTE